MRVRQKLVWGVLTFGLGAFALLDANAHADTTTVPLPSRGVVFNQQTVLTELKKAGQLNPSPGGAFAADTTPPVDLLDEAALTRYLENLKVNGKLKPKADLKKLVKDLRKLHEKMVKTDLETPYTSFIPCSQKELILRGYKATEGKDTQKDFRGWMPAEWFTTKPNPSKNDPGAKTCMLIKEKSEGDCGSPKDIPSSIREAGILGCSCQVDLDFKGKEDQANQDKLNREIQSELKFEFANLSPSQLDTEMEITTYGTGYLRNAMIQAAKKAVKSSEISMKTVRTLEDAFRLNLTGALPCLKDSRETLPIQNPKDFLDIERFLNSNRTPNPLAVEDSVKNYRLSCKWATRKDLSAEIEKDTSNNNDVLAKVGKQLEKLKDPVAPILELLHTNPDIVSFFKEHKSKQGDWRLGILRSEDKTWLGLPFAEVRGEKTLNETTKISGSAGFYSGNGVGASINIVYRPGQAPKSKYTTRDGYSEIDDSNSNLPSIFNSSGPASPEPKPKTTEQLAEEERLKRENRFK